MINAELKTLTKKEIDTKIYAIQDDNSSTMDKVNAVFGSNVAHCYDVTKKSCEKLGIVDLWNKIEENHREYKDLLKIRESAPRR